MEDKKTYSFDCSCNNCGNTFSASEDWGVRRPPMIVCPNCGNMATTSVEKERPVPYKLKQEMKENKMY